MTTRRETPDAELLALGAKAEALWQSVETARAQLAPLDAEWQRRYFAWADANPGRTDEQVSEAFKRFGDEVGLAAFEQSGRHPDDYLDKLDAISREIWRLPATTIAGLAVKARIAKHSASDVWESPNDDTDFSRLAIRHTINALLEIAARGGV